MTESFSSLETYARCPRKYDYAYNRNLEPKIAALPLAQGTALHRLMKAHYTSGSVEEEVAAMTSEVEKAPLFSEEAVDQFEIIADAVDLLARYAEYYGYEPWEVLHVEEEFSCEFLGGLTYTPDLVVRMPGDDDNVVWIVDHKTTSKTRGEEAEEVGNYTMQSNLYAAALSEHYDVQGFVFNFLRKKAPSEPRLAKTGKTRVAYLSSIDTTFDILRDFIAAEAPELFHDDDHRQRLAELRDRNQFFWREEVLFNEQVRFNTIDDSVNLLIMQNLMDGLYPRIIQGGWSGCNSCAFKVPCDASLYGIDEEPILEERFQQRKDK
jgi:hypothetical protein